MSKFDFKPVEPENKDIIDSYSYKYGENSCQHSLVSMYGHFDKYGDSFFEHEGWLYICRTGLCDESRKVYLCPLGDPDDDGAFAVALKNIMEDAHSEGKRVVFETVTANAKNRINSLMPGIFRFDYSRDYAEYIYSREKLAGSSFVTLPRDICIPAIGFPSPSNLCNIYSFHFLTLHHAGISWL